MRPPSVTKARSGYTVGRRCSAARAMMRLRWFRSVKSGEIRSPPSGVRAKYRMARSMSAARLRTGQGLRGPRVKSSSVGVVQDRDALQARCDFLEHPDPLTGDAALEQHQPGKI